MGPVDQKMSYFRQKCVFAYQNDHDAKIFLWDISFWEIFAGKQKQKPEGLFQSLKRNILNTKLYYVVKLIGHKIYNAEI